MLVNEQRGHSYLIQRQSSFILGFLPYISIPTRKILAANQTKKQVKAIMIDIDSQTCQAGGLKGSRTIMTLGAMKGMKEVTREILVLGFSAE